MITVNQKDNGYRGIWYMNQPSHDEYVYKYSGGLGTYCAKHQPFGVYSRKQHKTFFCYGGAREDDSRSLIHMVSYYDHTSGLLPRPTILLDKDTDDAHDNPVISIDDSGYIWIFSTSHGTERPSYIHRSTRPYDIDSFDLVPATRSENGVPVPFDNFSYMQVWHTPQAGFQAFLTHYHDPAIRTGFYISSKDGITWSEWQRLAAIEEGHYQISASRNGKLATAFNYHPSGRGLNWRTNLYYMESVDQGKTWYSADGSRLNCPLTEVSNAAIVRNYGSEQLNVYMKDICLDSDGNPVILHLTSPGFESGPANGPRTWMTSQWTGTKWETRSAMVSDNNYDTGSLYLEADGIWRLIAPTGPGPQPYNPGGEVAMRQSADRGHSWSRYHTMTTGSSRNHTYVRRPVNAHPYFYAMWADGDARKPSKSNLYFAKRSGAVYRMPERMPDDHGSPELIRGG